MARGAAMSEPLTHGGFPGVPLAYVEPDWWKAGYEGPLPEDFHRLRCPACQTITIVAFAGFDFCRKCERPLSREGDRADQPYIPTRGCPRCQHLACICAILAGHATDCPFRRAATCAVGIECDHGYDVCGICDPCTCAEIGGSG